MGSSLWLRERARYPRGNNAKAADGLGSITASPNALLQFAFQAGLR
jgi:hypothetical protein